MNYSSVLQYVDTFWVDQQLQFSKTMWVLLMKKWQPDCISILLLQYLFQERSTVYHFPFFEL